MRISISIFSLSLTFASLAVVQACSDDGTTNGATGGTDASVDTGAPSDAASTSDSGSGGDLDATADGSPGDASTELSYVGLVYAGRYNNIDQRTPSVTLGSDGRILGYVAGDAEAPHVTTASVDGIFDDTFAAASRWTAGNIEGPFYAASGPKPIPANDGQHLGIAKVAANLPASGSATYTLAAATKPTMQDGQIVEGSVANASLSAAFAGNAGTRIGYAFDVTMPDGTFTLTANGGPDALGDAGGTFSAVDGGFRFAGNDLVVTTTAVTCGPDASTCPTSGSTRVVFSGPNAERIVIAYVFSNGDFATIRRGVLVFKRT